MISKMKDSSVRYVCSECGHDESKWMGRCPECGAWNSFTEERIASAKGKAPVSASSIDSSLRKLSDIAVDESIRIATGIDEFDRVLGGGIMRPSSVLIGGEPGIGKSTIMLQVISRLKGIGRILYISGEESPSQVKMRAQRLGLDTDSIDIYCDTNLESISSAISEAHPAVIVIDSLQTLYSSSIASLSGSPNQVRACCMELSTLAKRIGSSVFFIGHVTKDGNIAGPKIVEHMVDTVLYFESAEEGMRLLRASKNRFGSVDEIGLFIMGEQGLEGVRDPSSFFFSERDGKDFPAGIAFTPIVEGSRTFIVEIQALVVPAKSGLQRIYSDRIDSARVSRVAAILERHAGLRLTDQDIYVNVAGGMKLSDVSIEMALALALYSSKTGTPVPCDLASFGELSLAGEVRPVSFTDRRLKAACDMGFRRALMNGSHKDFQGLKSISAKNIRLAIIPAFAGKKE